MSGGGSGSMGSGSGGAATSMGSHSMQQSAAGPASGKYGGFGSEDIARLGYNNENKFSAPYDPYTKGQSAPSAQTFQVANQTKTKTGGAAASSKPEKKKSKKSKKKDDSYDSESDNDDDDDDDSSNSSESEDSEEKRKKAKRAKRRAKQGLAQPPSKTAVATP